MDYLLYLPNDYSTDPARKFPLVVFLHGAGERGSDVKKVAIHGPPKLVAAGKQYEFILLSPQCPDDRLWNIDHLEALLDDVLEKYNVDRSRVYLTGMSMGGAGTWSWVSRPDNPFAAAVAVCGFGNPINLRLQHSTTPIWAIHGDADQSVPVTDSKDLIEATQKNSVECKLTIYPGVGHGSWNQAYDDPEVFAWMLSHRKK